MQHKFLLCIIEKTSSQKSQVTFYILTCLGDFLMHAAVFGISFGAEDAYVVFVEDLF